MFLLVASLFFSLLAVEVQGTASSQQRTPEKQITQRAHFSRTPTTPKLVSSHEHDIIKSLIEILKDKENARIYTCSFFTTNFKLAQALRKLNNKPNIHIKAIADSMSLGHADVALSILTDAKIPVRIYHGKNQAHAKYVMWSYRPHGAEHRNYGLYVGSANLTQMATQNIERAEFKSLSAKEFKKYKTDFENLWKKSEKFIPAATRKRVDRPSQTTEKQSESQQPHSPYVTPVKEAHSRQSKRARSHQSTTMFAPADPRISASLIERINKTQQGGSIYLSAYTYNDMALTQALTQALERDVALQMIVDRTALRSGIYKKSLNRAAVDQLNRLNALGAQIYVYEGRGLGIHHLKEIAIKDDARTISGHGSKNFTVASENDHNTWSWHPHDEKTFNEIVAQQQRTRETDRCTPYHEFIDNFEQSSQVSQPSQTDIQIYFPLTDE